MTIPHTHGGTDAPECTGCTPLASGISMSKTQADAGFLTKNPRLSSEELAAITAETYSAEYDEPVPDWAIDLMRNQEHMQATLDAILTKFEEITVELKPVIDTFANSPLVKMLGGKK